MGPDAPTSGLRRRPARPVAEARPQEPAQLVWSLALDLGHPLPPGVGLLPGRGLAPALDLLRAAHHDRATVAHALTLGRTHLRALPGDADAVDAVAILEAAITFLGARPYPGDIAGSPT
jgi:hypothetical protein